jgi:predicted Na+-dependent transporter
VTVEKLFNAIFNGALVVMLLTLICSLGMTFGVKQIVAPLRRFWVLLGVVLVNMALGPLLAIAVCHLLPLDSQSRTGLEIVTIAAGAPAGLKACQLAKRADMAMAVSFVIVLNLLNIVAAPLWAKAIVSGATVNPWSIVKDLVFLVLVPLVVGLVLRSRYPEHRGHWKAALEQISNIALYIAIIIGIAVNWHAIVSIVGSWVILASVLVILAYLVAGVAVGLPQRATAMTTSLISSMRFTPIGLVVISTVLHNQSGYLVPALMFALVDTIIPFAVGAEMGRAAKLPAGKPQPSAPKLAAVAGQAPAK